LVTKKKRHYKIKKVDHRKDNGKNTNSKLGKVGNFHLQKANMKKPKFQEKCQRCVNSCKMEEHQRIIHCNYTPKMPRKRTETGQGDVLREGDGKK